MTGAPRSRPDEVLGGRPVLVTGASGFIGRHVVHALGRAGARVLAPSRRPGRVEGAGEAAVRWVHLPDWSPESLGRALGGLEWGSVIHAAAYGVQPTERDAPTAIRVNAACAAALAQLAGERGVAGYVHVGSASEYDAARAEMPLAPSAPVETMKLYGATKLAGTVLSRAAASAADMPFAAARVFNVYGPGEASHRLLPSLVENLALGRPVRLSDGGQVRDFCYAGDVSEALVAMLFGLAGGARSGIYNVCTGTGTTVRTFAESVADAMGADRDLLAFGALPRRPDDLPAVVGDPADTERAFGWRARTALRRGVALSLEHPASAGGVFPVPI